MDQFYKCPKCQATLIRGTNQCLLCKSFVEWSDSGPKLITPSNIQPDKATVQPDKPSVQPDNTAIQSDKAAVKPDKAAVKPVKKSLPVWTIGLIVIIVLACIVGLFVGLSNSGSKPSNSPTIPPASTNAPTATATPSTSTPAEATTFIGNESSKIFHYPSCHLISELKSSNKVVFQSYQEAISKGYKPCGVCKPH